MAFGASITISIFSLFFLLAFEDPDAKLTTDPYYVIHLVTLYIKYSPSLRGKPLISGHIISYTRSSWRSNTSDLP